MSDNIRQIVMDSLVLHEEEAKKSHLLIREVLAKYDYLDIRDKAFIKRVFEGSISSKITLDYVINLYSKKPVDKLKPIVRAILRMSTYQILFMDKVPDSAAIDEAVKLCRSFSFEEFCPFVNAVLRNISKNKADILLFDDIDDEITRISVLYSCPELIVRLFKKEQKDAAKLLEAMSKIRATSVKILRNKDSILKEWKASGVSFRESRYVEDAFLIDNFEGAEALYGFSNGDILVQDESSMMASLVSGANTLSKPVIVDVCAAPGGKTCFTASNTDGEVYSFDVSEQKVSLISENVERLNLSNVHPMVQDARECFEELVGKADVVIADVPCSGLGVLARKSDIKYNVTNESMKEICDLQKEIVTSACRYLKKGGTFVYSTCTIHKAENEKMVKYIEDNLPLKGDSIRPYVPKLFDIERSSDSFVQILPTNEGCDGFFVARFIKTE